MRDGGILFNSLLSFKGSEVFQQGHIPGAVLFTVSECSDSTSSLPFTAPSKEVFQEYVRHLGIRLVLDTSTIYFVDHIFNVQ